MSDSEPDEQPFSRGVYTASSFAIVSTGFLQGLALMALIHWYGEIAALAAGAVIASIYIDWRYNLDRSLRNDLDVIAIEKAVPAFGGVVAFAYSLYWGAAIVAVVYFAHFHLGPQPPEWAVSDDEEVDVA